jgi:hypothetical protein
VSRWWHAEKAIRGNSGGQTASEFGVVFEDVEITATAMFSRIYRKLLV